MKPMELRPTIEEDDARIVEIYNLREHDTVPLTPARYRTERAEASTEHDGERYVAIEEGIVAGYSNFQWAWWTGKAGIYAVELRVDPHYARRGIGSRLFQHLCSQLSLRGATQLTGWIRADALEGRRFATKSGFTETGQVIQEYHLSITEADTSACAEHEARLNNEGVKIVSLAEAGSTDAPFLHALQRLWADSGEEAPDPEQLRDSFEVWQRQVLRSPGLTPETHWVALEGERPVGMTFLKRLGDDAFENDYTGVAATHRGRGIATALKLRAILWAQQHAVERFYTSSEIGNAAMIAINTRMGYKPGVRRLEVCCDLS
ncbi:MAG: GCN5-related N-acetyltransferase [Chthonomonadaceae bacterium]|nr:GCN5-related N-acetyltransferase [Chthonomonadaceae bacterium]